MSSNWGRYAIERSPLYRQGNKRKLFALLQVRPAEVRNILSNIEENYFRRTEEINGKAREIQLPIGQLRRLHDRLRCLLERVALRHCVMSPKAGVSIRDNADRHIGRGVVASFDIRKFYPSTTSAHVREFFVGRCCMAPDVAGILTRLSTIDGRLPFGSPLSPILCSHVHDDLFEEFETIAAEGNLSVSAWVDDVAVSGDGRISGAIYRMRKAVAKKGLKTHKFIVQKTRWGASVTGTVVTRNDARPSNEIHLKIRDRLAALEATIEHNEKLRLLNSLIGLHTHCLQVYSRNTPKFETFRKRKQWLCNERKELLRQPLAG